MHQVGDYHSTWWWLHHGWGRISVLMIWPTNLRQFIRKSDFCGISAGFPVVFTHAFRGTVTLPSLVVFNLLFWWLGSYFLSDKHVSIVPTSTSMNQSCTNQLIMQPTNGSHSATNQSFHWKKQIIQLNIKQSNKQSIHPSSQSIISSTTWANQPLRRYRKGRCLLLWNHPLWAQQQASSQNHLQPIRGVWVFDTWNIWRLCLDLSTYR